MAASPKIPHHIRERFCISHPRLPQVAPAVKTDTLTPKVRGGAPGDERHQRRRYRPAPAPMTPAATIPSVYQVAMKEAVPSGQ